MRFLLRFLWGLVLALLGYTCEHGAVSDCPLCDEIPRR